MSTGRRRQLPGGLVAVRLGIYLLERASVSRGGAISDDLGPGHLCASRRPGAMVCQEWPEDSFTRRWAFDSRRTASAMISSTASSTVSVAGVSAS